MPTTSEGLFPSSLSPQRLASLANNPPQNRQQNLPEPEDLAQLVVDVRARTDHRANAAKLLCLFAALGLGDAPAVVASTLTGGRVDSHGKVLLLDSVGHAAAVSQRKAETVLGCRPLTSNLAEVVKSVAAQLDEDTTEVVKSAVEALKECPKELVPFVKVVEFAVKTLSEPLRESAVELLRKSDRLAALEAVRVAMRDQSRTSLEIRQGLKVLQAIAPADSHFAEAIAQGHLENPDVEVRCQAALAVVRIEGDAKRGEAVKKVFRAAAESTERDLWPTAAEIGIRIGAPIAAVMSIIDRIASAARSDASAILLGAEVIRLLELARDETPADGDVSPILHSISPFVRGLLEDLASDPNSSESDERAIQAMPAIVLLGELVARATRETAEGLAIQTDWADSFRPARELQRLTMVDPIRGEELSKAFDAAKEAEEDRIASD